jgi:hypothetical protein
MKKLVLTALMLGVLAVAAQAATVSTIQITQASGFTAEYTQSSYSLNWSGGDGAWIYTDSAVYPYFQFDGANVSFDWTLNSDSSQNGDAAGDFTLDGDSWTLELMKNGYTNPVVTITGSMHQGGRYNGLYVESESGDNTLEGRTWLDVDPTIIIDPTWETDYLIPYGEDIQWDDDGTAGLLVNVQLDSEWPVGTPQDFDGYLIEDYYSGNGGTATLFAKQEEVPEPMTIALLGFGSLALLRRRK